MLLPAELFSIPVGWRRFVPLAALIGKVAPTTRRSACVDAGDNTGMKPTGDVTAGGSRAGPRRSRRAAIVGAITGYALVAALSRPLTDPALVAVLVAGTLLFWFGVRRRPRFARPVGTRSAAVWLAVAGVAAAGELALRLGPNDLTHPTLSTLADPALSTYPGRVVGYLLWIGVGAWLVSR